MNALAISILGALSLSQPPFDHLPGDASGPACPAPPATISTVDGRVYECHPEEGGQPYRDVTPPDDAAHWMLPFGSPLSTPAGTGTYHRPDFWPFRVIVTSNFPSNSRKVTFFEFDRHGVVVNSNVRNAIGDEVVEVRISGVRMWPTARVFYRFSPPSEGKRGQLRDGSEDGFVVANRMLCPTLDEGGISTWNGNDAMPGPEGKSINGHCSEVIGEQWRHEDGEMEGITYYRYPGFEASGRSPIWSVLLHDQPERPMRDYRGNCVAFCDEWMQAEN